MSRNPRVPIEIMLELYKNHGTLDRVAQITGLSRATVHEQLKRDNYVPQSAPLISADEKEIVARYYIDTLPELFSLTRLADAIGRPSTTVCSIANKLGLTDIRRPLSSAEARGRKMAAAGQWDRHPHPRGMLGKFHTDETKQVMKDKAVQRRQKKIDQAMAMREDQEQRMSIEEYRLTVKTRQSSTSYSRAKRGRRDDLGEIFFRSSWEANYARYLNLLKKMGVVDSWEYEPETFWFGNIRRGVRSYLPDFRVKYTDRSAPIYVEIKGWMDDKSKTKLARMKKYHPEIPLELIGSRDYRALALKWKSAIPTWE